MIDDDFMMLNNLLLEQIMQYWISEHCSVQQLEHNQFQCAMKMQLVSFNDVFQLFITAIFSCSTFQQVRNCVDLLFDKRNAKSRRLNVADTWTSEDIRHLTKFSIAKDRIVHKLSALSYVKSLNAQRIRNKRSSGMPISVIHIGNIKLKRNSIRSA